MRKLLRFLHLLLYIGTGITAQAYVNPRTEANGFSLEFPQTSSGTGVRICHKGHTLFFQDNPIQFIVYHPGTKTAPPEEASHVAPYSQVRHVPEGILACGILHTAGGIAVHFSDLLPNIRRHFHLIPQSKSDRSTSKRHGDGVCHSIRHPAIRPMHT